MTTEKTTKEQQSLQAEKIERSLKSMQEYLQAIYSVKAKYKNNLAEVDKMKGVYQDDVCDQALADAKRLFSDDVNYFKNSILESLNSMEQSVAKRHELLDLEDDKLGNALKIIQTAGSNITDDSIKKILSQFIGDQSSLRVLKQSLMSSGASPSELLDSVIYEPVSTFHSVRNEVEGYLNPLQFVSVNQAARQIQKIAKYEGFEFNADIDPNSVTEVTRAAAGLSEAI